MNQRKPSKITCRKFVLQSRNVTKGKIKIRKTSEKSREFLTSENESNLFLLAQKILI